jgi:hypothetical protein
MWWHTPVTPALRRLKQEALKFDANLGYIAYLKNKEKAKATVKFVKESHSFLSVKEEIPKDQKQYKNHRWKWKITRQRDMHRE